MKPLFLSYFIALCFLLAPAHAGTLHEHFRPAAVQLAKGHLFVLPELNSVVALHKRLSQALREKASQLRKLLAQVIEGTKSIDEYAALLNQHPTQTLEPSTTEVPSVGQLDTKRAPAGVFVPGTRSLPEGGTPDNCIVIVVGAAQGNSKIASATDTTNSTYPIARGSSTATTERKSLIAEQIEEDFRSVFHPIYYNYRLGKTLGQGSQGSVLLTKNTRTKTLCAVKYTEFELDRYAETKNRFTREIELQKKCAHVFVMPVLEDHTCQESGCFIMPYVNGYDLASLINKKRTSITQEQVSSWALQILLALKHIHSLGILHNDLKPDNIFVSNDGFITLFDFGLATKGRHNSCSGTFPYMAPEICREQTEKSDMWSLGVTLFELLTGGSRPFPGNSRTEVVEAIHKNPSPQLLEENFGILGNLVNQLLSKNPDARPSADELLRTPYFQNVAQQFLNVLQNHQKQKEILACICGILDPSKENKGTPNKKQTPQKTLEHKPLGTISQEPAAKQLQF